MQRAAKANRVYSRDTIIPIN